MKKKYDYNTTRGSLKLPEYGRNIQRMIEHLKSIEDREERNKAARTLISVMAGMIPQNRDIKDFEHKLWDHLTIMVDFDLDIDAPYPMPTQERMEKKPKKVSYNVHKMRYKHYGHLVEKLLPEIIKMKEGKAKEYAIEDLANQMKRQYLMWNRKQVTDEVIFKDMETLSKGGIKVNRDIVLRDGKDLIIPLPSPPKHLKRKRNQRKR